MNDRILFCLAIPGPSSAQPIIREAARACRLAVPCAHIIYGGVHPTYFWREILTSDDLVDAIVRGEGEATIVPLVAALAAYDDLILVTPDTREFEAARASFLNPWAGQI